MQSNSPDYWVRFPRRLLESDLSAWAKLLLPCIANLDQMRGCFATNPQLAQIASCSDRQVSRVLTELFSRGMLEAKGKIKRRLHVTEAGWALLKVGSGQEGEAVNTPAPLPPPTPAEEKPKKERKKVNATIEEHCARELPSWLPADVWRAFVEYRHKDKGPFTERSAQGVIDEVARLRSEGHDPRKLLELAAERGWLVPYGKDERTKGGPATGDQRHMTFGGRRVL